MTTVSGVFPAVVQRPVGKRATDEVAGLAAALFGADEAQGDGTGRGARGSGLVRRARPGCRGVLPASLPAPRDARCRAVELRTQVRTQRLPDTRSGQGVPTAVDAKGYYPRRRRLRAISREIARGVGAEPGRSAWRNSKESAVPTVHERTCGRARWAPAGSRAGTAMPRATASRWPLWATEASRCATPATPTVRPWSTRPAEMAAFLAGAKEGEFDHPAVRRPPLTGSPSRSGTDAKPNSALHRCGG